MVTSSVSVQPLASWIPMVYVPAPSPLNTLAAPKPPPSISYRYGAVPPVSETVICPSVAVGQVISAPL